MYTSNPKSNICVKKNWEIIFEVITASKIYDRFHSSHKYQDKFNVKKEDTHKCLDFFEIENVYNPCFLTIACNPKEYDKMFKNKCINKKHKGIKQGSPGMNFENYTERLVSLNN